MSQDPRGPHRTITAVEETPSETIITTDCGHRYGRNQIFTYWVGDRIRCFRCAQEGNYEPIITREFK